ncbi:alpha/beta hydrolase [Duganella sp. LX20W]|uniref:Alpha/beta hydrolase n=1 Tax=Rugamonas brunnea TaxID=2758569 RepID=A0A7W2ENJ9_9BURK|nr:alpha/beta hydrolase [Rugamonas brunnea]MBA5635676.1 alpha/beta hydrolase [Rugamonas brunnea]
MNDHVFSIFSEKCKWFMVLAAYLLLCNPACSQTRGKPTDIYSWYGNYRNTNTVLVFVHGIFGNSNTFLYEDPQDQSKDKFWPEMLLHDERFKNASVFLGGFYTDVNSKDYATDFAVKDLLAALKRPSVKNGRAVLDHKNIIFICHSTGGVMVRRLLAQNVEQFKGKKIGLLLIASPSLGSRWADRLSPIAKFGGNQLAQELEDNSQFLTSLDTTFKEIVDNKTLNITGIEAVENHFVIDCFWCFTKVVEVQSAARYFPNPRMLANTDHFSTVKPNSDTHPAYLLLSDFYHDYFQSDAGALEWSPPTAAKISLSRSAPRWVPSEPAHALKDFQNIDPAVCNLAASDATRKQSCTLVVRGNMHNPPQIGDVGLENVKLSCIGSDCTKVSFNQYRSDSLYGSVLAEVSVQIIATSGGPGQPGDGAAAPISVAWTLSATTSDNRLVEVQKYADQLKSYDDKVLVPVQSDGSVVTISAKLLDGAFNLEAGKASQYRNFEMLSDGDPAFYTYLIKR